MSGVTEAFLPLVGNKARAQQDLADNLLQGKLFFANFVRQKPEAAARRSREEASRGRLRGATRYILPRGRDDEEACRARAPAVTYDQALGLHALWRQYVSSLLTLCPGLLQTPGRPGQPDGPGQAKQRRAVVETLDLHGALLSVPRASQPALVGATGIVVRETPRTLQVVTRAGRVRTLPKRCCDFVVHLTDACGLYLHGRLRTRRLAKHYKRHSLSLRGE